MNDAGLTRGARSGLRKRSAHWRAARASRRGEAGFGDVLLAAAGWAGYWGGGGTVRPCGSMSPVYQATMSSTNSRTESPTRTVRALANPLEEPSERRRKTSATARLVSTATNNTITIHSNGQFLVVSFGGSGGRLGPDRRERR